MRSITCTRCLEFDAGQRVLGHEGKCAHLHGHRYKVELTAQAAKLDSLGRVIDFGVLKKEIGSWIDEKWDHGFLVCSQDTKVISFLSTLPIRGEHVYQKYFIMESNPTAENIAEFLLSKSNQIVYDKGIEVVKVKVWETPNCFAEALYHE